MIVLPTQTCLALRHAEPLLLDEPEVLPHLLDVLAGRELACQGESIMFWERFAEHMCDELPWLMNTLPPYALQKTWGTVAITAWVDKMNTEHGVLQRIRPYDPARVPRCPTHSNPARWFGR